MTRRSPPTRTQIALAVTKALRDFGYETLKVETVEQVLDAWIDGKREGDLPHGVIGMMSGRQFDEVDEANPGALAMLPKE